MRKSVFPVLFLALFTPLVATASQLLAGHVLDPHGAAVAHAAVTLRNTLSGAAQEQETSDSGAYMFASVTPGEYVLTVSATGLASATRSVQVKPGGESSSEDI